MVLARIDLHTQYDTQGDTVEIQFLLDSDKILRGSEKLKSSRNCVPYESPIVAIAM